MNFFTDLLFTQYYELKSKGRPTKSAKNTGILLLSVLIILLCVTVFMALYALGFFKSPDSSGMSGRALGRVVGIGVLALAYGGIYILYGKKEKYDALIKEYEMLSDEQQNEVYKNGMKRFFIAFIIMLFLIVVLAIV